MSSPDYELYPNQALIPLPNWDLQEASQDGWRNSDELIVRQGAGPLILLPIGGQEMAPYCFNKVQRAILALPGWSVIVVRGSISPGQVITSRPSYVNALLIASRGVAAPRPCRACQEQSVRYPDSYSRPFPVCIKLRGYFGGCCAGCKFRDHAIRCDIQDSDSDDDDDKPSGSRRRRKARRLPEVLFPAPLPEAGTQENPIELE
ncbi:hypothetical protein F5Y11DRAFT_338005 [Daldinia sp. FL1419]|nr:hypothetical protein F5Y11DRAFT_338005 [Daldinia sp. FL1419]